MRRYVVTGHGRIIWKTDSVIIAMDRANNMAVKYPGTPFEVYRLERAYTALKSKPVNVGNEQPPAAPASSD